MIIKIEQYIALFFVYSFAGWVMETVGNLIRKKKFVNRGFLIGPYCPIYGYGVLLITILLRKYTSDFVITFIMSLLICGTLEYMTSFIMEKIFKARWWDYSTKKFNINGRICLETLIPFGIAGCTIIYIINPFLQQYLTKIPENIMHIIISILLIVHITDICISFKIIFNLKEISKEFKDNTAEISERVNKILIKKSKLLLRVANAFPSIKENIHFYKWDELKQKIQNFKKTN